jgi:hypothetical protein
MHDQEAAPHSSTASLCSLRACSLRPLLALFLASSQALACSSASGAASGARAGSPVAGSSSVIRYRLPLHANPIDAGEAFRCYTRCQSQTQPAEYVECLRACPGFETTPGVACEPDEVPPVSACFTAHKVPVSSEPQRDGVVVGSMAGFTLIVALASVCASSEAHCHAVQPARR